MTSHYEFMKKNCFMEEIFSDLASFLGSKNIRIDGMTHVERSDTNMEANFCLSTCFRSFSFSCLLQLRENSIPLPHPEELDDLQDRLDKKTKLFLVRDKLFQKIELALHLIARECRAGKRGERTYFPLLYPSQGSPLLSVVNLLPPSASQQIDLSRFPFPIIFNTERCRSRLHCNLKVSK